MGTVAEKLEKLSQTKADIRAAIREKGQTVEDAEPFSAYGDKIRAIAGGGNKEIIVHPIYGVNMATQKAMATRGVFLYEIPVSSTDESIKKLFIISGSVKETYISDYVPVGATQDKSNSMYVLGCIQGDVFEIGEDGNLATSFFYGSEIDHVLIVARYNAETNCTLLLAGVLTSKLDEATHSLGTSNTKPFIGSMLYPHNVIMSSVPEANLAYVPPFVDTSASGLDPFTISI